MRIERLASEREVAQRAADGVARALAAKPNANLILPAGRTPVLFCDEIVRRHRAGELDLSRARLFQLDELVGVAPADARSFHAFLGSHVIAPAGLDHEGVFLLDGAASSPDDEIAAHRDALANAGGADLALLGIGRNGHVAFNEPGSQRTDRGRRVALAETTLEGLRLAFEPNELPTEGITLGIGELLDARAIVLLATGASKAAVVSRLIACEAPDPVLPASHFVGHADFRVLADPEALTAAPV